MKFMKFMDWGGQVTEFLYDTLGRLSEKRLYSTSTPSVSCLLPSGSPAEVISFSYDSLGRQSQISEQLFPETNNQQPVTSITSFSYDPDGRLISISSPTNRGQTYAIDWNIFSAIYGRKSRLDLAS